MLFKFTRGIINLSGEGSKPTPKPKSTKPLGSLIMFISDFVKIALPCVGVFLAVVTFLYRGNVFTNQTTSERFMVFALISYGVIDWSTRSHYLFIFFAFIFSVGIIAAKGKFYKEQKESEIFFSLMLFLISVMSYVYNTYPS